MKDIITEDRDDLRQVINTLRLYGFQVKPMTNAVGIDDVIIYKWLKGERPINIKSAKKLEDYLVMVKNAINELIDDK